MFKFGARFPRIIISLRDGFYVIVCCDSFDFSVSDPNASPLNAMPLVVSNNAAFRPLI